MKLIITSEAKYWTQKNVR